MMSKISLLRHRLISCAFVLASIVLITTNALTVSSRRAFVSPYATTTLLHRKDASATCTAKNMPSFAQQECKRQQVVSFVNNGDDGGFSRTKSGSIGLGPSDQGVLGSVGIIAALVTFYSEYVLKGTGCGIPAGPFGLFGLVEGLSYLVVVGIGSFSLYTKVRTGSGLPAGPNGLLGAAEGLSFLAIVAGLAVLGFQILDYGYIPNAVPTEGGICK